MSSVGRKVFGKSAPAAAAFAAASLSSGIQSPQKLCDSHHRREEPDGSWLLWRPEPLDPSPAALSLHPRHHKGGKGGEICSTESTTTAPVNSVGRRESFDSCLELAERQVRQRVLGEALEGMEEVRPPSQSRALSRGNDFSPGSFSRVGRTLMHAEEETRVSLAVMDLGAALARNPEVQRTMFSELSKMVLPRDLQDSSSDGEGVLEEGYELPPLPDGRPDAAGCDTDAGGLEGKLQELGEASDLEALKQGLLESVQERLAALTSSLEAIRLENLELKERLAHSEAKRRLLEARHRWSYGDGEEGAGAEGGEDIRQAVDAVLLVHSQGEQSGSHLEQASVTTVDEELGELSGAASREASAEAPAAGQRRTDTGSAPRAKPRLHRRKTSSGRAPRASKWQKERWWKWAAGGVASAILAAAMAYYFGVDIRAKLLQLNPDPQRSTQ